MASAFAPSTGIVLRDAVGLFLGRGGVHLEPRVVQLQPAQRVRVVIARLGCAVVHHNAVPRAGFGGGRERLDDR